MAGPVPPIRFRSRVGDGMSASRGMILGSTIRGILPIMPTITLGMALGTILGITPGTIPGMDRTIITTIRIMVPVAMARTIRTIAPEEAI